MNSIRKILILEDEKPNADRLQRLLSKIRPDVEVVEVLPSIKKTVAWLEENECPDLVLMDIQLSDGISFEVFNLTKVKCPVIFTTAHDEYAIKAFKYNSIDYLLKPIAAEELETAMIKFEHSLVQAPPQYPSIENLLAQLQPKTYRERFLIPYRDGYKKIEVADIVFFYSHLNISNAILCNTEQVIVPQTLETLEQELDPKLFFRINRQYIIHVNAIDNVHNFFNGKLKLKLKNCADPEVFVSRTKAPLFKAWLDY